MVTARKREKEENVLENGDGGDLKDWTSTKRYDQITIEK